MNVDNFDEAIELLKHHGFTEAPGAFIADTGSAKSILIMASCRGFPSSADNMIDSACGSILNRRKESHPDN